MRRRRSSNGDSLDLLLDTICNTFGGVVFIALLVALLLRLSPSRHSVINGSLMSSAARQWLEALGGRQADSIEVDGWRRLAASQADDRLGREIDRLLEMKAVKTQLERELGDTLLTVLEVHESINEIEQTLQQLTSEKRAVAEEQSRLEAEASSLEKNIQLLSEKNKELRSRIQSPATLERPLELPKEREDLNAQITAIVKYGRIYFPFNAAGVNDSDFFIDRGWVFNVAKPKPFAGIAINADGKPSGELAQVLAGFPPEDYFIHLIVCEDSFDYFQTLKSQLLGLGYRQHLTPLAEGQSVWESTSGPSSSQ